MPSGLVRLTNTTVFDGELVEIRELLEGELSWSKVLWDR